LLPGGLSKSVEELLPLSEEEMEQILSNDITERMFGSSKSGTLTLKNS